MTESVTRLKEFIREKAPGGCKILSQGDACTCPLCGVDALAAKLAAAEHQLVNMMELAASSQDDIIERAGKVMQEQVVKCFETGGRFGYHTEQDAAFKINQLADSLETLKKKLAQVEQERNRFLQALEAIL